MMQAAKRHAFELFFVIASHNLICGVLRVGQKTVTVCPLAWYIDPKARPRARCAPIVHPLGKDFGQAFELSFSVS